MRSTRMRFPALLLCLLLICCSGCGGAPAASPAPVETAWTETTADAMGVAASLETEIDAESAADIAESYLRSFQKQGWFPGYEHQLTQALVIDGEPVWAVCFWAPMQAETLTTVTLSPTLTIAVCRDRAEIFGMWVNE